MSGRGSVFLEPRLGGENQEGGREGGEMVVEREEGLKWFEDQGRQKGGKRGGGTREEFGALN